MTEKEIEDDWQKPTCSREEYRTKLQKFDAAVCEAIAVSQATANNLVNPTVGYSTHIFTRMCGHAQTMLCAAPNSRWVKRDFDTWDASAVAPHARSILEGYILFSYLVNAPTEKDEQDAYVQVMHLYDCLKRVKILPHILLPKKIESLEANAKEIKEKLEGNRYFSTLDEKLKKQLLAGKYMMITPKKDVIAAVGIDQAEFDFFWNYLSQYTHILSFTFYRIEKNGRGTGLENGFDRGALCMMLKFCTTIITAAIERLIEVFPDAKAVQKGVNSKFSPGPHRNLPKHIKRARKNPRRK